MKLYKLLKNINYRSKGSLLIDICGLYHNNTEVKDKLYYTLNVSPNPNQNSSQFINKFIV